MQHSIENHTTYYTNKKSLEAYIVDHHIKSASSLLIQIFSAKTDQVFISTLLCELTQLLPDAVIIGTTTDGEIMNGKVSTGKVVLSFTKFAHTRLKCAALRHVHNECFENGRLLAQQLIGEDTKLIIALADGLHTNGEELLSGIASIKPKIPVAGGMAGDNLKFEKTLVFTKDEIMQEGVVAVALESKQLRIHRDYSFCWQSIGNEMTVTKVEKNRLYTLNNIKVVDLYTHYLGIKPEEFEAGIGIEFPLIVTHDGLNSARAIRSREDDGSVMMAGNLSVGDKVRIGFGDAKRMLHQSQKLIEAASRQPSEVIFVYSCAARRYFIGNEIEAEVSPLQAIAPVCGFFTYGEFFTQDKNELFNQTMTIVSLSESNKSKTIAQTPKITSKIIKSNYLSTLVHLINVTSLELQEYTEALEQSYAHNEMLKERLELALLGSHDGVWDWNIAEHSLYFSPRWKEMIGYRDDEFANELSNFEDHVHHDDLERVREYINKNLYAKTENCETIYRLRHKAGHWVWVLVRGKTLFDEKNHPVRMIGTMTDITEQKKAEALLLKRKKALHQQAYYDTLTRLPNRSLFMDRLEHALIKAKRSGNKVALFFIDLDKFKHINDSYGHLLGDTVLKIVAKRLSSSIREGDTLARLSGDEFALIAEEISDEKQLASLAQKLLELIEEPICVDELQLSLSLSIGISIYPDDASQALKLLEYADTAMYTAKENGRNTFEFYALEMTTYALARMRLIADLREAFERDEFILHYQPQIDALQNKIVGMEALIRWENPKTGLALPSTFLPLAEETGMAIEIDKLVIKKAISQTSQWSKEGIMSEMIALNISAKQLEHQGFAKEFGAAIKSYEIDPSRLVLELSEARMIKNDAHIIEKINELNALGIHLSIDDFGIGCSSPSFLKRSAIYQLKIDQTLIKDIPQKKESIEIIKAIIALAKSLDIDVIAKGVERAEQKACLLTLGCVKMQGNYFSKPLPPQEAEVFLREHLSIISKNE